MAGRFEARVDVLHIWPPEVDAVTPVRGGALWQFAHTRAGEAMKAYLAALEQWGVEARGRLECGDPSATILDAAEEGAYDLIVMGTHGHSGLAHWLLGGTTEKVVRRARCPVLTVHGVDRSVPAERARAIRETSASATIAAPRS
jgi:nucleotide-binding universal stress UspA family protein